MDYKKIYDKIINNAKLRVLPKETYVEIHHIIPRCLEGSDDKENLVRLTLREHFICHMLLVLIYPDNRSLKNAAWLICTTTLHAKENLLNESVINRRKQHFQNTNEKHINITSRDYEYCKALYYEAAKGKKRTKEQCKTISEATKEAMRDPERVKKRRKGVLGTKHYYNIETGEHHKWFPGDPDIDLTVYRWGRNLKNKK